MSCYPNDCTSPNIPTTVTTVGHTVNKALATTGSSLTTQIVLIALFMLVLGAMVWFIERRR